MAETIGARIRQIRARLSQADFSAKIGVHKDLLGKYERDQSTPGGETLSRMREVLGVDINWLLTGDGEMFPARGAPDEPALKAASTPIDDDLYGRVTEAVSTAYRECGYTATLYQVAAEAARIAADLTEMGLSPEERSGAIKGAVAQLRRRLREAVADPAGDAAAKRPA